MKYVFSMLLAVIGLVEFTLRIALALVTVCFVTVLVDDYFYPIGWAIMREVVLS